MVNYQIIPAKVDRVQRNKSGLLTENVLNFPTIQASSAGHENAVVVQLPHNPGFVENQLRAHHLIERPDYHCLTHISSQDEQKKLQAWFHSKQQKQQNTKLIELGDNTYHIVKSLGQGGMAHIYLVQDMVSYSYYGLKVQQPAHPWEYYIHSILHQRRRQAQEENNLDRASLNLIPIYHFYHYKDAGFLLMDHVRHGSLLDALNMYRPSQTYLPEPIVVLLTLQLLEQIKTLHDLHVVHNDLKLDNVMLVMKRSHLKETIMPNVVLIDYGYSVDILALVSTTSEKREGQVLCRATWPPACAESDFPYLNQPHHPIHADYWQLATMAHLLLFGSPMHTTQTSSRFAIQQPIRRYWHKSLWTDFFRIMLNPPSPPTDEQHTTTILQDLLDNFKSSSHDIPKSHRRTFITMLHDRYKI
ncbi:MAG: kinase-like domain-containing protein [Benjaminiella poitrasii]|nr:MAG: kinase-like domain-containing protein [Benjaminiella poitrasii]